MYLSEFVFEVLHVVYGCACFDLFHTFLWGLDAAQKSHGLNQT